MSSTNRPIVKPHQIDTSVSGRKNGGGVHRVFVALAVSVAVLVGRQGPLLQAQTPDPGCEDRALVSAGGRFPRGADTLAVRWTGYSNFELAYKNQVWLLDAYFDRGTTYPPLGFSASDVTRANLILIGHGHFDHMSDAAPVAMRTGAVVIGAPVTTDKLLSQNVDPARIRTVTGKGGEELRFERVTIQPILARHGEPPAEVTSAFDQALQRTTPRPTEAQVVEQRAIRQRGTNDPRVIAEGTIAYILTLDNGFRIMYRDSGGTVTEFERAAMSKLGRVDLALAATAASVLPDLTASRAVEYARVYKPSIFIPAHHDGSMNDLWRPTEPLFEALKKEMPGIVTHSRVYREPVCIDTTRRPGGR
jgi:L-ascorbate metabolism protein UlaG (beta-lactamase superfamily)